MNSPLHSVGNVSVSMWPAGSLQLFVPHRNTCGRFINDALWMFVAARRFILWDSYSEGAYRRNRGTACSLFGLWTDQNQTLSDRSLTMSSCIHRASQFKYGPMLNKENLLERLKSGRSPVVFTASPYKHHCGLPPMKLCTEKWLEWKL